MPEAFAISGDVKLGRPLTTLESEQLPALLDVASAQLRQRLRNIDDRIALYETDPTDEQALDPILAMNVVVNAVRRYLHNPTGALNVTRMTGPYSSTLGFGERTGNQFLPRGVVLISDDDVATLLPASTFKPGSIRVKPWRPVC